MEQTKTTRRDSSPATTNRRFNLNGVEREIPGDPRRRLLDVLREDFNLLSVKEGCGEGECGACSILVDGRVVDACILPAGAGEGRRVETLEAIRDTPRGERIVTALSLGGGVQCGFCIPGIAVALEALLRDTPAPDDRAIREGISGNLCRCTGYQQIVEGVLHHAVPEQHNSPEKTDSPDKTGIDAHGNHRENGRTGNGAPSSLKERDRWFRPGTLEEALFIRAEYPTLPLAGATDLYVRHRALAGTIPTGSGEDTNALPPFLFLGHLDELTEITVETDPGRKQQTLRIGAAATYTDIAAHPAVPELLRKAIAELAAPALRNVATLGGNIGNASPAADAVCALYALHAEVELRRHRGARRRPIEAVITGPGSTAIEPDELITAVLIPLNGDLPVGTAGTADNARAVHAPRSTPMAHNYYRKVGTRRANALSKISVAGTAVVRDGRFERFGLALGAVGPRVIVDREMEKRVIGTDREQYMEILPELRERYTSLLAPISDQRSTEFYRRTVTGNLLRDFLLRFVPEALGDEKR